MSRVRSCLWLLLSASLAWFAAPASAHPLAPALLQLQETAPGRYAVLWRTSVSRTQRVDVMPQLPPNCRALSEPQIATEGGDAVVARWAVQCAAAGLVGQRLTVQGLTQSGINVIVHILDRNGAEVKQLLSPDQPAFTVPSAEAQPPVFAAYFQLGVEHLLGGLDHLLFVASLLWLVRPLRLRLATITAFTLGHSFTLAAASLGLVHVPQAWAELGIALSLLLLAVEISRSASSPPSRLARWPWLMATTFGLLHGLGFAGALADIGLPQGEIALALLAFNLGIEAGQLLWVFVLLLAVWCWRKLGSGHTRPWMRVLPAYLIGTLAAYWCWDRLIALWA